MIDLDYLKRNEQEIMKAQVEHLFDMLSTQKQVDLVVELFGYKSFDHYRTINYQKYIDEDRTYFNLTLQILNHNNLGYRSFIEKYLRKLKYYFKADLIPEQWITVKEHYMFHIKRLDYYFAELLEDMDRDTTDPVAEDSDRLFLEFSTAEKIAFLKEHY